MSRYLLIPAEEMGGGKVLTIDIPEGLVSGGIYSALEGEVKDRMGLRRILEKMRENNIVETQEGYVKYGNKVFKIKMRDALLHTVNHVFLERYEDFYKLLRKCGIKIF